MAAISKVEDEFRFYSVQELVKQPIKTIPKQYIRLDQQQQPQSLVPREGDRPFQMLPIIDMNQLLSGDDLELQKLHSTCKEWGFFQLVEHGVESSVMEKVKEEVEGFYELPLEEKMKYKIREDQIKEGNVEGYGNTRYDWSDRIYITVNPISRRKPHLFSHLPSSLRNTMESYILELQNLATKLLSSMAKALKIDEREMIEYFDDGIQGLRMNYYPPCPQPEMVAGIVPHSDATIITILNQLNGVDGLHIHKDGVWFPVSFLPNALVVNVGDILEMFSNGVYRSIEHKVVPNSEKERMSVSFFIFPKTEADVGPSPSLINPQNPPLFKGVGIEQYLKDFFSRTLNLNGKTHLQALRINGEDD